jgi:hypothetical protein
MKNVTQNVMFDWPFYTGVVLDRQDKIGKALRHTMSSPAYGVDGPDEYPYNFGRHD